MAEAKGVRRKMYTGSRAESVDGMAAGGHGPSGFGTAAL